MHQLRCIIIRAPFRGRPDIELKKAYLLWEDVWVRTFKDIDPETILVSDKFTMHDEVITIFNDDEPIALGSTKILDLDNSIDREDSFILGLPKDFRNKILKDRSKVMAGGYLTISHSAKGINWGFPTAEVIVGLMMRSFLTSDAERVIATMRADIPAYATALQLGAEMAATTVMHNVPVAVISASKRAVESNPDPLIDQLIDDLWVARSIAPCDLTH